MNMADFSNKGNEYRIPVWMTPRFVYRLNFGPIEKKESLKVANFLMADEHEQMRRLRLTAPSKIRRVCEVLGYRRHKKILSKVDDYSFDNLDHPNRDDYLRSLSVISGTLSKRARAFAKLFYHLNSDSSDKACLRYEIYFWIWIRNGCLGPFALLVWITRRKASVPWDVEWTGLDNQSSVDNLNFYDRLGGAPPDPYQSHFEWVLGIVRFVAAHKEGPFGGLRDADSKWLGDMLSLKHITTVANTPQCDLEAARVNLAELNASYICAGPYQLVRTMQPDKHLYLDENGYIYVYCDANLLRGSSWSNLRGHFFWDKDGYASE
jgi:hypothetical protein